METTRHPRLRAMQRNLSAVRERLLGHDLYRAIASIDDLRVFCRHHVFAVWDFMSLLKALQRRLTSMDEVWRPVGDPVVRRLINEVVLGEETDDAGGVIRSHFEMYLAAMRQVGAPTDAIEAVLAGLAAGEPLARALQHAPEPARQFSATTFEIVGSGSLPAIAAAFTIGREEVIPAMFTRLVAELAAGGRADATLLVDYLDRHIEVDGEHHGPMAERMLVAVCGDDDANWQQAERAAERSLLARIALWGGVLAAVAPRTGANGVAQREPHAPGRSAPRGADS